MLAVGAWYGLGLLVCGFIVDHGVQLWPRGEEEGLRGFITERVLVVCTGKKIGFPPLDGVKTIRNLRVCFLGGWKDPQTACLHSQ